MFGFANLASPHLSFKTAYLNFDLKKNHPCFNFFFSFFFFLNPSWAVILLIELDRRQHTAHIVYLHLPENNTLASPCSTLDTAVCRPYQSVTGGEGFGDHEESIEMHTIARSLSVLFILPGFCSRLYVGRGQRIYLVTGQVATLWKGKENSVVIVIHHSVTFG